MPRHWGAEKRARRKKDAERSKPAANPRGRVGVRMDGVVNGYVGYNATIGDFDATVNLTDTERITTEGNLNVREPKR